MIRLARSDSLNKCGRKSKREPGGALLASRLLLRCGGSRTPRAGTARAVLFKPWFVLSPVESYLLLGSGTCFPCTPAQAGRQEPSLRLERTAGTRRKRQHGLLNKDTFTELVAPHKGLRPTEALEQQLNLAVVIDVLRRNQRWGGQELQVLLAQDAIAVKPLGPACVEHGQNSAAIPQPRRDSPQKVRQGFAVQVVQQIPEQDGIHAVGGLCQVGLQETFGAGAVAPAE